MTIEDEKELIRLVKENNHILKTILGYIEDFIKNSSNENINDFIRNVIANLVSNRFNIK